MFGIDRTVVSKTLKDKDRYLGMSFIGRDQGQFRHRDDLYPLVNEAVAIWVSCAQKKIVLTDLDAEEFVNG